MNDTERTDSGKPGRQRARWSVVSTVAEPLPLLIAFVSHHLAAGASEVILHLDMPDRSAADCLESIEGCRVILPRDAHSGVHMPTPERQSRNAAETYAEVDTDWLLHIDADEFLVEIPMVQHMLDRAAPEQRVIGVAPAERVWRATDSLTGIFDGVFRLPIPREEGADQAVFYGPAARYLDRGLSSNGSPKCFVRTGHGLEMGVHRPKRADGTFVQPVVVPKRCLLHFDGATPRNYIAKLQRKVAQQPNWDRFPAPGRREQLREVWAARGDQERLDRLTRAAKFITPEQEEALEAAGLLYRPGFDASLAIEARFGRSADLSVAAFDAVPLQSRSIGRLESARNRFRSWRRLRRQS